MEVKQVVCDECGVTKGETNHWWIIGIDDEPDSGRDQFAIVPGKERWKKNHLCRVYVDVCSQQCATKKLSEWLSRPRAEQA